MPRRWEVRRSIGRRRRAVARAVGPWCRWHSFAHPEHVGDHRRLVIGGAGAVAIVLAVVVAVVWTTRDGDETTTAATTTTAEVDPPASTTTAATTTTASTPTTTPSSTTSTTPSTTASTTASTGGATPTPPTPAGNAGPGCVNGWIVPSRGSRLRVEPLDIIRQEMRITGRFQVTEMRYFTGPEVPWILAPRSPYVEWWYVKAHLVDDPAFRGRWLVARRWEPPRKGIAAAAPFDTEGYRSPDWRGFIGDSPPHAVQGLPGMWTGDDFDFTVGDDPYLEHPGLPHENARCLDGT